MKKTHHIALIASVVCLLAVGAYSYMIFVTVRMSEALTEKVTLVANSSAQAVAYNELKEFFDRTVQKREVLARFALTEDEAADFLNEIESVGTQKGLSVTTNNIKIEKKKDTPDQLAVQFAIEGDEQTVRDAVMLFEKLPYKSSVSALMLGGEGSDYRATIDLLVTLVKYDK